MKFKTTPVTDIYGRFVTDIRGKAVKRPMVEVGLIDVHGKKVHDGLALIDSGPTRRC